MNVLILTDFSKVAENAGKYAVQFLGNAAINFYLLNIQTFSFRGCSDQCAGEKKMFALKKLDQNLSELKASTPNSSHTFQAIFSDENLVNATRKYVIEKKIDLIVMGASGKDVQYNAILGNHTYDIIRKIKCTVLAVPHGCLYQKPENIVLPIDFSASLDTKIFQFFENPSLVWKKNITVIEIIDNGHTAVNREIPRKLVSDQLNISNLKFIEMEEAEFSDEILLMGIQKNYDMIVILGKNLSVCERLLHTKYGICTAVSNALPILVLHG